MFPRQMSGSTMHAPHGVQMRPSMLKTGYGRIVNIASISGKDEQGRLEELRYSGVLFKLKSQDAQSQKHRTQPSRINQ